MTGWHMHARAATTTCYVLLRHGHHTVVGERVTHLFLPSSRSCVCVPLRPSVSFSESEPPWHISWMHVVPIHHRRVISTCTAVPCSPSKASVVLGIYLFFYHRQEASFARRSRMNRHVHLGAGVMQSGYAYHALSFRRPSSCGSLDFGQQGGTTSHPGF